MRRAWYLLLSLSLPLTAWGPKGHRLVAEGALRTLPSNLRIWYLGRESGFTQASLEPDLWKERDPAETMRHRIFCETYGGPASVPVQESSAKQCVGPWAFEAGGQLPWVIAERYRLLVRAFQGGDPKVVVAASGWLCHYIADAQVPLHTTRNRNGKETAQKGVHKRWETQLLERGVGEFQNFRSARASEDPSQGISTWILESHGLVAPLLEADRTAALQAGLGGASQDERFWENQKGVVHQQLQRSSEYTGDFLLSAWMAAGEPLRP